MVQASKLLMELDCKSDLYAKQAYRLYLKQSIEYYQRVLIENYNISQNKVTFLKFAREVIWSNISIKYFVKLIILYFKYWIMKGKY